MRRRLAALVAVALAAALPATARERGFDSQEHVLRRAALELAAGRPDTAAAAFDDVTLPAPRDERAALAVLLRAEALILSHRDAEAAPLLQSLRNTPAAKPRALAAAHALGLVLTHLNAAGVGGVAGAPGDDAAGALALWERERGACTDAQAALGDLAAAAIAMRLGDTARAERALVRVDHPPAEAAALVCLGEAALERHAPADAKSKFAALARTPVEAAEGWLAGWGRVGVARALATAGDSAAARAALRTMDTAGLPAALVSEGRLYAAQLAFAQHDLPDARALLTGLDLRRWNATLDAEARLLSVQVGLDRGDFTAAESLAVRLGLDLPELEREAADRPFEPSLLFDVRAWHESLTQTSLAELASRDVLRRAPEATRLHDAQQSILIVDEAPRAARNDLVALRPLLVHEPEPMTTQTERAAWRRVTAAANWEASSETALDAARARLAERQALLARGRARLESTRLEIEALAVAAGRLHAGLAAHAAALAALEQAWVDVLRGRLVALEQGLTELDHGNTRLEARYPETRVVRRREPVARARARQAGEHAWTNATDSTRTAIAAHLEQRLHDIFVRHEYAADAAKLDSLDAWVVRLRAGAEALARAMAEADGRERLAVAAAESVVAVARAARGEAEQTAGTATSAAIATRVDAARARTAAYVEGAAWGGATGAFLSALATPPGDATRVARLQHASSALEAFCRTSPHSERVDEALYRLGECALQRATLEHQADLAAFVAHGGRAEQAPVPTEGYGEALAAYRRLLTEHPQSPRVHDASYEVGFLLAEMGSLAESCEHLEAFLAVGDSLDERHGRAALRLGDNRLMLEDRPAALVAFRRAAQGRDSGTRDLGLFKQGWCAFDLDAHAESRTALHALLEHALADSTARAVELAPEALELLALAFAAEYDAGTAARTLDAWGRPPYDFTLLLRMAQLFASRAQYDETIATDELVLVRHPDNPALPAVAEDLLHWIEVRHGTAAMHARAATLAPVFARGSDWAQQTAAAPRAAATLRPRWQSRLVEEDALQAQADSTALALANPEVAAARMAQRMRAAAAYEHRAAQHDTLHAADGYRRAITLYERTLQLFPGAADEATTWLWLGEARFGLGDPVHAADAYKMAAAHPHADSALAHTASIQELAALDAAAAHDPQAVLDRYAETTDNFAKRYPRDGRATDAWARVGSLAFAVKRWDQSVQAYEQVARSTPDGRRAASALKIVGDVEWQRERFEEASVRYDSALVRARAAHADSLTGALTRLVPASLYRGAETRESRGDRDAAASAYERVATAHPQFDLADRSLYRAAGLRAAGGDSARAANDFARLIAQHPRSALVPDAELDYARCRESLGQREAAARAYRAFARQHPEHAQARAARLRSGLLFAATGQSAAADSQYAVVLRDIDPGKAAPRDPALAADLWVRRARLASGPEAAAPYWRRALACGDALGKPERAEARFQIAEAQRPDYQRIRLLPPIVTSLQRKQKAVEGLIAGYGQSAEEAVQPWHAAACLRLGETLADFGQSLRQSEPPAELQGDDLMTYQESIGKQADTLDDRAVEAWSRGLSAARRAKHSDEWTRLTEKKLWPMLAVRVPTRPAPMFVLVQP